MDGLKTLEIMTIAQNIDINSDYVKITDITLNSSASTISISNIPNTYEHLEIFVMARSTDTDTTAKLFMKINENSGSVYSGSRYYNSNAVTISVDEINNATSIDMWYVPASLAPTGLFGMYKITMLCYANNAFAKPLLIHGGAEWSTSSTNIYSERMFMQSDDTSAVQSISFNANLSAKSRVIVYGIKGGS